MQIHLHVFLLFWFYLAVWFWSCIQIHTACPFAFIISASLPHLIEVRSLVTWKAVLFVNQAYTALGHGGQKELRVGKTLEQLFQLGSGRVQAGAQWGAEAVPGLLPSLSRLDLAVLICSKAADAWALQQQAWGTIGHLRTSQPQRTVPSNTSLCVSKEIQFWHRSGSTWAPTALLPLTQPPLQLPALCLAAVRPPPPFCFTGDLERLTGSAVRKFDVQGANCSCQSYSKFVWAFCSLHLI